MRVPEVVLKEWLSRKQRGDISAIHRLTGFSRVTINKALSNGNASAEVILEISKYYSDKEIVTPQEVEAQAMKILKNNKKWLEHFYYVFLYFLIV